jgi:hypothetical protein
MVSALANMVIKNKDDLKIARSVRTTQLPPNVISGEFFRQKFTKKLLMGLPQGAWLVGNCIPRWTAHLSDRTDAQRVWKQATECRATHRLVSVLWSEQDVKIFTSTEDSHVPPTILRTKDRCS